MNHNKLGPAPFLVVLALLAAACVVASPFMLIVQGL